MTPRILLVEDTPDIALWLGTALRQGGMAVEFATDGHAAERCLQPGHGFDACGAEPGVKLSITCQILSVNTLSPL